MSKAFIFTFMFLATIIVAYAGGLADGKLDCTTTNSIQPYYDVP